MRTVLFALLAGGVLLPSTAFADTGAPPPDQKALVTAPKPVAEAPKVEPPTDATAASVSAGGQLATGNSRLLAVTANGKFDMRRGANGFGASIIANYGESPTPPTSTTAPLATSTENFQGRLRYDRYVLERMSLFLAATVRHDKFQGLDGRFNLDPGVKYLFVQSDGTALWGELGYDFQYDARNGSALTQLDANGDPIPGAPPLAQTATDESIRVFVGFKHAFNSAVTLVSGVEYLQSLYSSDTVLPGATYDYRINFDALFAANVGAGFSVGLGFSARYDNAPLPGKVNTDTITTFNLIYAFSDAAPPAPTCPCVAPPPAPSPPPPPPATATAPASTTVPTTTTTTITTPTTTTVTTTTAIPTPPATSPATPPTPPSSPTPTP